MRKYSQNFIHDCNGYQFLGVIWRGEKNFWGGVSAFLRTRRQNIGRYEQKTTLLNVVVIMW